MHVLFCWELKFFFFFFGTGISIIFIPREQGFPLALHLVRLLCTCVTCLHNATSIMHKVTLAIIVTQEVQSDGLWFWQWSACLTETRIWCSLITEDQSNIQRMMLVPCITRCYSKHNLSSTGVKCDFNWSATYCKILNIHIWNLENSKSSLNCISQAE